MNGSRSLLIIVGAFLTMISLSISNASSPPGDEGTQPEEKWTPIQPIVAWTGSYSRVEKREYHRIIAQEEWAALWQEHLGEAIERDSYGEPVVPAIDFDQFMVIAIFNGESWNTRSMALVEQAASKSGSLRIRFDEMTYQTSSIEIEPIVMEGDATPEEIARKTAERALQRKEDHEKGKAEDPNYTSAYGIFVLPKSGGVTKLIENVQELIGEPPKWKLQHTFEVVN